MSFHKKNKKASKKVVFNKTKDVSDKEVVRRGIGFFNWIQEFSKKIVVIAFFIYILMDIVSLAMVIIAYKQSGDLMFIDTIVMEANQTFRDVIGGYILKAATENISKGVGMITDKYLAFKEKEFEAEHPAEEVVEEYYDLDEDPEDGYDI